MVTALMRQGTMDMDNTENNDLYGLPIELLIKNKIVSLSKEASEKHGNDQYRGKCPWCAKMELIPCNHRQISCENNNCGFFARNIEEFEKQRNKKRENIYQWAKENGIETCPSCGNGRVGFTIKSEYYSCSNYKSDEYDAQSYCDVKGKTLDEFKRDVARGFILEEITESEMEDIIDLFERQLKGEDKKNVLSSLNAAMKILKKYRRAKCHQKD